MRTAFVLSLAVVTLSAASCGKKSDPVTHTASASGSESEPMSATANTASRQEIGGQIARVGEHQIELRLFANGRADAVVRDAQGALLDEKSKAMLFIHANAANDARPIIELTFDPALGRFAARGAVKGELTPGAIDLELRRGDAVSKGRLDAAVLLVGPQIGGTLVVAGKNGIELDARVDGRVEAFVSDAAGAPVNGGANLGLEVKLADADGRVHAIKLAWDETKARFVGQADAAVKLAAGPADVFLNGEIAAHLPTFVPSVDVDAKAKLDAAANAKLDAKAKLEPKAKVATKAGAGAKASANVKVPKVEVSKSASASVGGAGGSAKAGFSFGTK